MMALRSALHDFMLAAVQWPVQVSIHPAETIFLCVRMRLAQVLSARLWYVPMREVLKTLQKAA